MTLAGLEGELLLRHGLGVELGESVGGSPEGGVERTVGLVKASHRLVLPLPPHAIARIDRCERASEQSSPDRRRGGWNRRKP
jgi:hypothetical protein